LRFRPSEQKAPGLPLIVYCREVKAKIMAAFICTNVAAVGFSLQRPLKEVQFDLGSDIAKTPRETTTANGHMLLGMHR
jgi:hypothetical protein